MLRGVPAPMATTSGIPDSTCSLGSTHASGYRSAPIRNFAEGLRSRTDEQKHSPTTPLVAGAAPSVNPLAVALDSLSCLLASTPTTPALPKFRDISSQPLAVQIHYPFRAAKAFVRHRVLNPFTHWQHGFELIYRCLQGIDHRRSVSRASGMDRDSHRCPGVEVDLSALWAEYLCASFIFVMWASGSGECVQSWFELFLARLRSSRTTSSRIAVVMPESFASRVRNSW